MIITILTTVIVKTLECNYSGIKMIALVIIYAVKKFHQCLYGTNFVSSTDDKPLLRYQQNRHGNHQ